MSERSDAEFRDYVGVRLTQFRREIYASCGDWHEAEDLVQHALEKLYPRWNRIRRGARDANDYAPQVDGYVRKTMYNKLIDERKSARSRYTNRTASVPEYAATDTFPHDDHDKLVRALLQLPKMQRAVVVLRHWQDVSVSDTADALGISTSQVKNLTKRGCASLARDLSQEGGKEVPDQWKQRN